MKTELKFHNPDNLETAGDPPWRFLVEGEVIQEGDEFFDLSKQWHDGVSVGERCSSLPGITYRTRAPLPAPQPGGGGEADKGPLPVPGRLGDPHNDVHKEMQREAFSGHTTAIRNMPKGPEWYLEGGPEHEITAGCPPTAPIALPVRAEAMDSETLSLLCKSLTILAKHRGENGDKTVEEEILFAVNQIAALSRELEELRAWKEEITGAIYRSGLGIMRTSQGPSGTLIGARPEVEEAEHKKVLELIRENVDLDLKVTALRAELEEAKAERDGLKQQIGWHEEANADHRRWVRHLDVLWNGEAGAAKQAALIDVVAQIERELPAPRAAPRSETEERDKERWQPIETAPKDGTYIFAYWDGDESGHPFGIVRYVRNFQRWEDNDLCIYANPTHWQPLPPPPALAHDEKGAGE